MTALKVFSLLLILTFSYVTWAGTATPVPTTMKEEDEPYQINVVTSYGWRNGHDVTGNFIGVLPTYRPVVQFTLVSKSFVDGTAKRGSYCNDVSIKGFWTEGASSAVANALSHAKHVIIDPKDFTTESDQETHNDGVIERQTLYNMKLSRTGLPSAMPPYCYQYNIDPKKIMIVNEQGQRVSLDKEAKKNKIYSDDMENYPPTVVAALEDELKMARGSSRTLRDGLEVTVGKTEKTKLQKRIDKVDARINQIEADLKRARGAGTKSNTDKVGTSGTAQ